MAEKIDLADVAIVKETGKDYVLVEMMRTGACDKCAMTGFCHGNDKTVSHRIETSREFRIGDKVRIHISANLRIASSLLIFLFPIIMLIISYAAARYGFDLKEEIAIIISFSGLIISGFIIYHIDKKLGSRIKIEILEKID